MPTYKVPVHLRLVATAYVEAESPEAACEQSRQGQWLCYHEDEIAEVLPPDEEDVEALADHDGSFGEAVLHRLVRHAQHQAASMSQVEDHAVLHLLDAALALLGDESMRREQALTQAREDCQRALGTTPPAWAEMRVLLQQALGELGELASITETLDDGNGTDGQDWSESRAAAAEVSERIGHFLERLDSPTGIPLVRVDVSGGVAHLVAKPRGVAVELRDYDTEGADPEEWGLVEDGELKPGHWYACEYSGPDEEQTR
jgi:hypothetical protein